MSFIGSHSCGVKSDENSCVGWSSLTSFFWCPEAIVNWRLSGTSTTSSSWAKLWTMLLVKLLTRYCSNRCSKLSFCVQRMRTICRKTNRQKNYVSSCQMRRDAIAFGILRLLSFQGRLYSGAFNDCHCLSQHRAHYAALCCTLLRQFRRVLEVCWARRSWPASTWHSFLVPCWRLSHCALPLRNACITPPLDGSWSTQLLFLMLPPPVHATVPAVYV